MKFLTQSTGGWKSYTGAAVIFVAGGLLALGIVDQKTFEIILTMGGALLGVGLRAAIKK